MEQETLFKRVLNRVLNKEHSPKAFKRLASLVLAGAIGLSVSACNFSTAIDGSSKDSSSKYEDSSNIDSSSIEEPPIEVDYTKFSPIIQAMFNNDYYVNLTQKIKENIANKDYADYYSHPYTFWESRGVDIDKIKSGETPCRTNAYILDEEPNNLYIGTFVADPTNTYYDQYIIRYTLTDQEVKEYYTLRILKCLQNFYMNDILSIYKKPEIIMHGKINIETYNLLVKNFDFNLVGHGDIVFSIAGEENGKPVFSYISYSSWVRPSEKYPESNGLPFNGDKLETKHLVFNDGVECSIEDGIIYINPNSIKDLRSEFYTMSKEDLNGWYDEGGYFYYQQDFLLEGYADMYTELKPEDLQELSEKMKDIEVHDKYF